MCKCSSHRKKSTKHFSSSVRYIGFISFAILLLVLVKSGSLSPDSNVLGVKLLAQNMTPEQQMQQQAQQHPQQQGSEPQQQSQPQQQQPQQQQPNNNPQQQQQQMTPQQQEQMRQQYQQTQQQNGGQPNQQQMTTEQKQQYQQYQQASPQKQQEIRQQYQQQNQRQDAQQQYAGQQQNGSVPKQQNAQGQQQGQYQATTQEQQQMTTEQKQQYQQYQQMTPQQQQEMNQKYQQEAKQMQQQWQQQAAQNGFQISAPTNSTFPGINSQHGSPNQNSGTPPFSSFPTIKGQFFVSSANGGSNVNLNDKNTNIVLDNDNSVKARKADGTEVTINKDALEKITTAIKLETGSEISQNGNAFIMKRGQVEAQTNFPISFNVATKTFSVNTPTGVKEIAVLPDQAVEKAIQSGVISNVSKADTTTGTNTDSKVKLTEYNSHPVYQVNGDSKQKVFGLLPVSIGKTTYISAENGNVITTNQSFFSRFLDTISF